jgi:hypothetical protein
LLCRLKTVKLSALFHIRYDKRILVVCQNEYDVRTARRISDRFGF